MTKLTKTCETCGHSFDYPPSDRDRRFCSAGCKKGGKWKPGEGKGALVAIEADLIAGYNAGKSIYTLASETGHSASAISVRLRKAGVVMRDASSYPLTPEQRKRRGGGARRKGQLNPAYKDLPINEMQQLYAEGISTAKIGRMYGVGDGTVSRKLVAAGVQMRQRGYSRYRRAKDGHMVQSGYEEAIDDWLFDHGLAHEIQPPCPWVVKVHRNQRADFRVGTVYIEMWGIIKNRHYDAKREAKLVQYHECGAELIQLFPHHILNHDYSPLERLLA